MGAHGFLGQEATGRPTIAAMPQSAPSQDMNPAEQSAKTSASRKAESRTGLAVDRKAMSIAAPLLVQHDENPDYTRDYLRVQWRPEDSIDLYVYRPRGAVNPPVILYLYSYPDDSRRFLDAGWAQRATSQGYAAVGFVSALTGERYHSRPMKEWFVSELRESLTLSVHDVQLILDYLATRGDLDMSRVGMFGEGSGGTIAALAGSVDPRLKAIEILNPWGDWPDWFGQSVLLQESDRAAYSKPEFLATLKGLDPVEDLGHLPQKSLRLEQVASDQATPNAAKEKLAAAAGVEHVVQYPDMKSHAAAWHVSGTSGWLKSRLGGESRVSLAAAATGKTN